MKNYQVELLAPAGNVEAFLGAIHAGADAVYLGGNKYGARAYADNFTTEELIFCIRYAHLFGRKVYLTVNTLMKDFETEALGAYIAPFYEAGLDACIVQDFGAFQYLKKHFPQMELHASTQMTITGVNSTQLLKEMGATRIVPARELSLEEIKNIKAQTGLEIETFIHGAMCYCYSGQCLFSSILGGRSGNRGRCAQPCRLPYQVALSEHNTVAAAKTKKVTNNEHYPLSLKDMCTIEHMEALMDAGIDSFKIEGRMKKPEYAAGVTAIYRKYIDQKKKHPDKPLSFTKADLDALSKLYIRSERQDGYYFKQNGADMVTLTNPSYSGSDDRLLREIRSKYIEAKPKLPISLYATFVLGEKVSVTYVYKDISITVDGEVAEEAKNMPLTCEGIEKQLKKLGDTAFEVKDIQVYTDNKCFYSIKALNDLRRQAVTLLEDKIIESHGLTAHREINISQTAASGVHMNAETHNETVNFGWTLVINSYEQYEAFLQANKPHEHITFKRIYLESELVLQKQITPSFLENGNVYIALPYVMRAKDEEKLKKLIDFAVNNRFNGFLVRNLEEYAFLKKNAYMGEIRGDAGIYIWNKEALSFWNNRLTGLHCPIELNKKEWKNTFAGQDFEKLVYGRIPMMVTANCVAKTTGKCMHNKYTSQLLLKDRYNKQFPVSLVCEFCMNIIYNSVPLSLHKDVVSSIDEYDKKLQLTVENKQETIEILKFFKKISEGQLTEPPFRDYTTGHEKRGVL